MCPSNVLTNGAVSKVTNALLPAYRAIGIEQRAHDFSVSTIADNSGSSVYFLRNRGRILRVQWGFGHSWHIVDSLEQEFGCR
jgi:hypothetical protein